MALWPLRGSRYTEGPTRRSKAADGPPRAGKGPISLLAVLVQPARSLGRRGAGSVRPWRSCSAGPARRS